MSRLQPAFYDIGVIYMKTHIFPFKIKRASSLLLTLTAILLTMLLALTGCRIVVDLSGLSQIAPGNGSSQTSIEDKTPTETDGETGLPPGYIKAYTQITEGIRLEVLFNQESWRSGDKIKVLFRVTNMTEKPIPWQAGSMSFGPAGSIQAFITLQGSDFRLLEDGEPRMGDTAMLYGQLEPGDSIEKTVVWTTAYTLDGQEILQAWSGDHTLNIAFARGQEDNSGFLTWQQSIKIEADGTSLQIISRDQAIDIARNQPEYDAFRLAHSGDAVAKIENGQYFVNFAGTWEKVTEELYQETFNKMMAPGAAAQWQDGIWRVVISEKLGDPPNELIIEIDGYTGKVLSIK